MKSIEKFSDLTVVEASILSEALNLWCNFDRILEPSIMKTLLSKVETDEDRDALEKRIEVETERIFNLKKEDTMRIKNSLDTVIAEKTQEEINTLVGDTV
jgi:hypothetical protein